MSGIYLTNVNDTVVQPSAIVPNSINKGVGQAIFWFSNSVVLRRPGYYKVTATVTFTAATPGNISFAIQKDGVNVPGITATETITTADTEVRTVVLSGVIRVLCHEGMPVISLVNDSDSVVTTSNVSITITD